MQKTYLVMSVVGDQSLKELCETADIVLVPSIWSVPIEGALLKSMRYAKRVVAH